MNFENFLKTFRRLDPLWNTGQKNFSIKLPQNKFKTRLDTFGNDFGHPWNFATFLKTFRRLDPPWNTGQKNFQKITPKHVQNTFGQMGHDFGRFFEVWKFFKNNSKTRPSLEHWAKKNSRKNYPKTCSKHVWSLLGTILIIFGILQFFWKHFEDSTLLGTLGKKLFQKNYPKTCSKHVSTNWERVWAFFQFWKIFKNISKTGPSLEH